MKYIKSNLGDRNKPRFIQIAEINDLRQNVVNITETNFNDSPIDVSEVE